MTEEVKNKRRGRRAGIKREEVVMVEVNDGENREGIYRIWENVVRYIEVKGDKIGGGVFITAPLWRRIKRIKGKGVGGINEDDWELIKKMIEGGI